MAKGKLRIRQRGSRQQWAKARDFKVQGALEPAVGDETATSEAQRILTGGDVVQRTRCGLCGALVEQRLRDGRTVVLLAHSLCMSCDEVRCQECWQAPDDPCIDADEHELMEAWQPDATA
jgi:hypothetical protein